MRMLNGRLEEENLADYFAAEGRRLAKDFAAHAPGAPTEEELALMIAANLVTQWEGWSGKFDKEYREKAIQAFAFFMLTTLSNRYNGN